MVQIIDEAPRRPKFAEQLLAGAHNVGQQLPGLLGKFEENRALEKRGIDLKGIHSPEVRAAIIAEGLKRGSLLKSGEASIPERLRQSQAPGTAQQNATAGVQSQAQGMGQATPQRGEQIPDVGGKTAILTPEQLQGEAVNRVYQKQARNEPTTFQDELANLRQEQADVARYKDYQTQVGEQGVQALEKYYPDANEQQKDAFRRIAEQESLLGLSEAERKAHLTEKSRKFVNELRNLEKVQGKRIHHKLGQTVKGSAKSEAEKDRATRAAIKPFLDRGDYTTVRDELSRKGYGPEEVESFVATLSEPVKKTMSEFIGPKAPSFLEKARRKLPGVAENVTDPSFRAFRNDPEGQREFGENLQKTLQADPNANLVLLRKAYEDKGVDWSAFKDEFDNLVNSGAFKPTDDQTNMLDKLQEPPLDRLDRILANFNLIGR